MMAKALKCFKDAGDFDAAIREWEVRPAATQTYANLKTIMNTEFTKLNRQDATTARAIGHGSANNVVKEMAKATEELIAELTEHQGKQVESLMKSTTEALENSLWQFSRTSRLLPLELEMQLVVLVTSGQRERQHGQKEGELQLSAHTAIAFIQTIPMTSVGSYRPMQPSVLLVGNRQRAPEGARGFQ